MLNPPRPRYTAIWDVKIVVGYLSLLENVNKLDLKMLTIKLTMLLCLVTAQRSQTLHLLKLSNMISEGNFITNRLTALVRPVTWYLTRHRRMWYPTGFKISSAPLCSCPAAEYIYWARLT